MMADQDYVLGTHDEELHRLGLQHRAWRARMLDAWAAAGITVGSRVVDLGCGPGYATVDLAELVGPSGEVLAVERSTRFAAVARDQCAQRGLTNVRVVEADLAEDLVVPPTFDAVWCRWVAMFVPDLPQLVRHAWAALRPGGVAIFHEYVNYASWRAIPSLASLDSFVTEAMASFRDAGGTADVAPLLLPALTAAGFEVVEATPLLFSITPGDFFWHWLRSFLLSYAHRLAESGRVTEAWSQQVSRDFTAFEQSPGARMLTPTVLQVIARKTS